MVFVHDVALFVKRRKLIHKRPLTPCFRGNRCLVEINGKDYEVDRAVANHIYALEQENYSIATRVPGYEIMGLGVLEYTKVKDVG